MTRPTPLVRRVVAPDGRVLVGRAPRAMPTRGEGWFVGALAQTVGGACSVALPGGRADVVTRTHVFEVERAGSWRVGVERALSLALGVPGLRPALALFGAADYLPIFLHVRDRIPGFAVWGWVGIWEPLTTRPAIHRRIAILEAIEEDRRRGIAP